MYDGFGNLTSRQGTGTAPTTATPTNAANNQLQMAGVIYDANGNLLSTGNLYDAENRLRQANMPGGTIQYFYDGQNKRIWQGQFTSSGDPQLLTIETVAMFGADGKLAGTYTPQANWTNTTSQTTITFSGSQRVYFAGKLIKANGQNLIKDRLGSQGRFYPYGEQRDSTAVAFATYTRDGTGLDYADQRFYTNTFGRFMTPDPYNGNAGPSDPGSWNRYSYVQSDPMNRFDPSGTHYCKPADDPSDPSDTPPACMAVFGIMAQDGGVTPSSGPTFGIGIAIIIEGGGDDEPAPPSRPKPPGPVITCEQLLTNLIDGFLIAKGSPLAGHGSELVKEGEAYNVDPRLLVGIAGAESHLDKDRNLRQINDPFGIKTCILNDCHNRPFPSLTSAIDYAALLAAVHIANGQTSVSSLYSGKPGAWCVDSPGRICSDGAKNVTSVMQSLGGDPNNLLFHCP